jgi:hypothetical protein
VARVLGEDDRDAPEHLDGARRQVAEVADGRADDEELAGRRLAGPGSVGVGDEGLRGWGRRRRAQDGGGSPLVLRPSLGDAAVRPPRAA